MTRSREQIIDLASTPYYHCMSRCVRRAYLCGEDDVSGRNFDHRKGWVVEKLKHLSDVFGIDVCAYAVMSNHYHVVLRVDEAKVDAWSDEEVVERWKTLFHGPLLIAKWQEEPAQSAAVLDKVKDIIEEWRQRLKDISWYMRVLNETIARQANAEDDCKGRFWENRFKSQALLDESALLTCMMYVDLNPIRAGVSDSLQASDFTSIQQRIREMVAQQAQLQDTNEIPDIDIKERIKASDKKLAKEQKNQSKQEQVEVESLLQPTLLPFSQQLNQANQNKSETGIPFLDVDYLALIDWTGRAIRDDKKGAIPEHIKPILAELGINQQYWLVHVKYFGSRFPHVAGRVDALRRCAARFEQLWFKGCGSAKLLFEI